MKTKTLTLSAFCSFALFAALAPAKLDASAIFTTPDGVCYIYAPYFDRSTGQGYILNKVVDCDYPDLTPVTSGNIYYTVCITTEYEQDGLHWLQESCSTIVYPPT